MRIPDSFSQDIDPYYGYRSSYASSPNNYSGEEDEYGYYENANYNNL